MAMRNKKWKVVMIIALDNRGDSGVLLQMISNLGFPNNNFLGTLK